MVFPEVGDCRHGRGRYVDYLPKADISRCSLLKPRLYTGTAVASTTLPFTCMKAFDVRLNGKELCVAGIDGDGALNTMIDYTAGRGGQRLSLRVGGLATGADEFMTWCGMSLSVGDEITVKIVEVDAVDPPRRTPMPQDSNQDERGSES